MPTLDATVSGASANSYLTRAAALLLIDDLPQGPFTAFLAASGDNQDRYLIGATERIETMIDWNYARIGDLPAASTQRLLFPRVGTWNRHGDDELASDAVPEFVLQAVVYQAAAEATTNRVAEPSARGLVSAQLGPMAAVFDKAQQGVQRIVTDIVWKLLAPWRSGGAAMLSLKMARA